MLEYIPEHLDFDVEFEPTKVDDKKYVINSNTGDYIGIVGNGFTCANHGDFFRNVMDTTTETLSEHDMEGAEIKHTNTFQTTVNHAYLVHRVSSIEHRYSK